MKRNYNSKPLLKLFLDSLLALQDVDRGSIWVKQDDCYLCVEASGDQSDQVRGISISDEQPSIVGWVIENGRRTISDAVHDTRHFKAFEDGLRIKSHHIFCFPLILETGHVYGAIQLIETSEAASTVNLDHEYLELLENIIAVGSVALSNELAYSRQIEENRELREILDSYRSDTAIIGQSGTVLNQLKKIQNYSSVDYTVLITGESGTGKELFARELHRLSARRSKPFLVQNCSAIPETLLESELFGHKKGAFTGANRDKKGLFESADGGTVFLDEIGDMPFNLQARILRVMQDGEIKPLGSSVTKHVDLRIVSATNSDLNRSIAEKRFREDLFYRLNVLPLHIPPLRDRQGDIPLLIKSFIIAETKKLGIAQKKITKEAMFSLEQYQWPGNVRELENFVRHILVMTPGDTISIEDLPPHYQQGEFGEPIDSQNFISSSVSGVFAEKKSSMENLWQFSWRDLEEQYIHTLLLKTKWNISEAARMAKLNRSTFDSRMKRLGIRKRNETVALRI